MFPSSGELALQLGYPAPRQGRCTQMDLPHPSGRRVPPTFSRTCMTVNTCWAAAHCSWVGNGPTSRVTMVDPATKRFTMNTQTTVAPPPCAPCSDVYPLLHVYPRADPYV